MVRKPFIANFNEQYSSLDIKCLMCRNIVELCILNSFLIHCMDMPLPV